MNIKRLFELSGLEYIDNKEVLQESLDAIDNLDSKDNVESFGLLKELRLFENIGESFNLYEAQITNADQIRKYTDLSRPLSRELYKHHRENTIPPEFIDHYHLPTLDKISQKGLSKNVILYTGIRHDPRNLVDANNTIHSPAFLSTSTKFGIGSQFAHRQARRKDIFSGNGDGKSHIEPAHILKIHVKKGQLAGNISKKSLEKHEDEYLIPRNTVIKIDPTPEINDGERPTYVWDCYIISQG